MSASDVERRLVELGCELGSSPAPLGHYVRAVRTGDLVFTAGHGPMGASGELAFRGQVGAEVTPEEARRAAQLCALACLASVRDAVGDLDRVARVVKLLGFVNCAPGFTATSAVVDGASELLEAVFGARGVHARSAIGTSILPLNMPVELEMVLELR